MTDQEAFDHVVAHLRKQNEQARADPPMNNCRYRDEHGRSCAVGCLLTDEEYEKYGKHWEGHTLSYIPRTVLPEKLRTVTFSLLSALQAVHDNCPVTLWEEELRNVAKRFSLVFP